MITLLKSMMGLILMLILMWYVEKKLKNKVALLFSPIFIYVAFYLLIKLTKTNLVDMLGSVATLIFVILAFSFMIIFNYVLFAFERIAEATSKKTPAILAIIYIALSAIAVVILFSLIYMTIYNMIPNSFTGSIGDDCISQAISFLYFSVVTFTTVGYGDILAVSNLARLIVIVEMLYTIIIVVFAISCFSHVSEALKLSSPFEVSHEDEKKD